MLGINIQCVLFTLLTLILNQIANMDRNNSVLQFSLRGKGKSTSQVLNSLSVKDFE